MKIVYILPAFVIIVSSLNANAQENSSKAKIILTDIYVTCGKITQIENAGNIEDFQEFVPQSNILKRDFTDFADRGSGGDKNSRGIFTIMVGLRYSNSEKNQFRIGASIFANAYASARYGKTITTPLDTFTSAQTNEEILVNKATDEVYSMYSRSNNISLDVAYIHYFFPKARISFFTGFGIGSNFSIHSYSDIFYSERYSIYVNSNSYSLSGSEGTGESFKSERFLNKGNFGVTFYVPLGLDFQVLGNGLLHKTHLIYEFRPGFNAQFGGMGDFTSAKWQHNFGVRIALK